VKWSSNKSNESKTLILKFKYTDTIQDVKKMCKSQITSLKLSNQDFDLASVYPRKIFNNLKMTLEQAELVPNSNILIMQKSLMKK
jgi:hypothetical protein